MEETDLSETIGEKERLKQRVHITRSSLILESDMRSLLFRVVAAGQVSEATNPEDEKRTCGSCATEHR